MAAKYLLNKKSIFSDFENIAHCCYTALKKIYIYIYVCVCIYMYVYTIVGKEGHSHLF